MDQTSTFLQDWRGQPSVADRSSGPAKGEVWDHSDPWGDHRGDGEHNSSQDFLSFRRDPLGPKVCHLFKFVSQQQNFLKVQEHHELCWKPRSLRCKLCFFGWGEDWGRLTLFGKIKPKSIVQAEKKGDKTPWTSAAQIQDMKTRRGRATSPHGSISMDPSDVRVRKVRKRWSTGIQSCPSSLQAVWCLGLGCVVGLEAGTARLLWWVWFKNFLLKLCSLNY